MVAHIAGANAHTYFPTVVYCIVAGRIFIWFFCFFQVLLFLQVFVVLKLNHVYFFLLCEKISHDILPLLGLLHNIA